MSVAVRVQQRLGIGAEAAYAAFCDVEAIPAWVPVVQRVEVVSRDRDGRPGEVAFDSRDELGASLRYSLHYSYDTTGLRVMWRPGENPDAGVRGVVEFEPLGRECRITYTIDIAPTWADDHAKARALATAVVDAFCRWLTRRDHPGPPAG